MQQTYIYACHFSTAQCLAKYAQGFLRAVQKKKKKTHRDNLSLVLKNTASSQIIWKKIDSLSLKGPTSVQGR